jgi:Family of unknown function (DUF6510)
MDHVDGNAIAGPLIEHYGNEMTTARGTCIHCGISAQFAELRVYTRAPGAVGRCPGCGGVVVVLVWIRKTLRIDDSGFTTVQSSTRDSGADV